MIVNYSNICVSFPRILKSRHSESCNADGVVKCAAGAYVVARTRQPETEMDDFQRLPVTRAVSLALRDAQDPGARSDLLFLETWQIHRPASLAATLRASQIRRANPGLAAEIERELKAPNPGLRWEDVLAR
jgi:hypothetical protein